MNIKWLFERFAVQAYRFLNVGSIIAGILSFLDLLFRPFETTFLTFLVGHIGISLDEGFALPAEVVLIASSILLFLFRHIAQKDENRHKGVAQLADACCIHTLRLVTLLQELRKCPERASNALDSAGLRGIPVDSARFRFRIANVNMSQRTETKSTLISETGESASCADMQCESLITSDVEYDFKFKLTWYARFRDRLPLVSWIFGDNGKQPQQFRYYYSRRTQANDIIASPQPYKNSSFSYSPNQGLYVVSHDVCPASAGVNRIFGFHYYKQGCSGWDFDDDFTVYPTAITGSVRRATFRVELEKGICDALDSCSGALFELHEVVCCGKDPGNGYQPAHFERRGTIRVETPKAGVDAGMESVSPLFSDREYLVFETPEIKVNPENVYIILVRTDDKVRSVLRQAFNSSPQDGPVAASTC